MASVIAWLRAARYAYPWALDAALALVMLIGAVVSLSGDVGHEPGVQHADSLAYLIAACGVVPYYFRRRFPLPALAAATVPVAVMISRDYTSGALGAGLFLLAYSVASWRPRREVLAAGALIAGLLSWITVTDPEYLRTPGLISNVVLAIAALVVGSWAQSRRAYIGWMEERAALIERDREQRAREAVLTERLRIARDLHDLVAASMGVVAVQAGVGEHVIDSDPDAAKRSLHAIAVTSRETLAEIRRLVSVLRAGPSGDDTRHRLAELPDIVERTTGSGVDVAVAVCGAPRQLPVPIEDAAYHVVQEALTNVVRHAHASHATITLDYGDAGLVIDVEDNGNGVHAGALIEGHGLRGLAERVGACGGELRTGRGMRGFTLSARLPVEVST